MSWRKRIKGSFEAFVDFEYRGGKLNEENKNNIINSSRIIIENLPTVLKSPKSLKREEVDGRESEISPAFPPSLREETDLKPNGSYHLSKPFNQGNNSRASDLDVFDEGGGAKKNLVACSPDHIHKRDQKGHAEQAENDTPTIKTAKAIHGDISIAQNSRKKPSSQRTLNQTDCPARCKRTGKCFGRAWFEGKPGPSRSCIPQQCFYADRFEMIEKVD